MSALPQRPSDFGFGYQETSFLAVLRCCSPLDSLQLQPPLRWLRPAPEVVDWWGYVDQQWWVLASNARLPLRRKKNGRGRAISFLLSAVPSPSSGGGGVTRGVPLLLPDLTTDRYRNLLEKKYTHFIARLSRIFHLDERHLVFVAFDHQLLNSASFLGPQTKLSKFDNLNAI